MLDVSEMLTIDDLNFNAFSATHSTKVYYYPLSSLHGDIPDLYVFSRKTKNVGIFLPGEIEEYSGKHYYLHRVETRTRKVIKLYSENQSPMVIIDGK